MKILYHILYPYGLGDDRFTYEGYKDAFEDMGHSVLPLTERDDVSALLEDERPDIFITEINAFDLRTHTETLRKFRARGGKVLLHGAMREDIAAFIARESVVDGYFSELDPRTDAPSFPSELFFKMHWLAASRKYHFPVPPQRRYQCDVMYLGARLPKKEEALTRFLLPLRKKYDVRIYGFDWDFLDRRVLHPLASAERRIFKTGHVSSLRLQRQVPMNEENVAYASAKICLNFHEAHPGITLKTINARTFKIPASGGFEMSDYVPQLREFFDEDELVMPKNESEWFSQIEYYLTHETERRAIQEKGTARAQKDHTFHSRVGTILYSLA